ncbi:MAG: hypothetical protein RR060_03190, partial [Victivallaceae bacterium]
MFNQNKIFFICAAAIVLCCLILGYIALKVARSEQNFRYAELRNSAAQELNSTNNAINNEINVINFELASLLQESNSLENLYALPIHNPMILNLFLANADGELIYPERNGDFFRRYARLFEYNSELTANLKLNSINSSVVSMPDAAAKDVDTYEVNVPPEERNVVISQQKLINTTQTAANFDNVTPQSNRMRVIRYNNRRTDGADLDGNKYLLLDSPSVKSSLIENVELESLAKELESA